MSEKYILVAFWYFPSCTRVHASSRRKRQVSLRASTTCQLGLLTRANVNARGGGDFWHQISVDELVAPPQSESVRHIHTCCICSHSAAADGCPQIQRLQPLQRHAQIYLKSQPGHQQQFHPCLCTLMVNAVTNRAFLHMMLILKPKSNRTKELKWD